MLVSTERYGSLQYGTVRNYVRFHCQSCEWYQIANRTVPLFWYPFVGVPSTAKVTKRVKSNQITFIVTSPQHKCLGE